MIIKFLTNFVFGALLVFAAAYFYPFPQAPRFQSGAEALANGGREEAFFVRLPDDRLGTSLSAATAAFPRVAFAANGEDKIVAELFQARDAEGKVIGVASRLSGKVADVGGKAAVTADWMLLFPSRGALFLSQGSKPVNSAPDDSGKRMGFAENDSGIVIRGTDEFEGLNGFYREQTDIDRVDSDGVAYGLLTLTTRLRSSGR